MRALKEMSSGSPRPRPIMKKTIVDLDCIINIKRKRLILGLSLGFDRKNGIIAFLSRHLILSSIFSAFPLEVGPVVYSNGSVLLAMPERLRISFFHLVHFLRFHLRLSFPWRFPTVILSAIRTVRSIILGAMLE